MSETPTKWETWHTQSPLADTGDYMYSCGITNGVNYLYLQDETDEDEILPELCKQLNSFEEREPLLKEMAEVLESAKKDIVSLEDLQWHYSITGKTFEQWIESNEVYRQINSTLEKYKSHTS